MSSSGLCNSVQISDGEGKYYKKGISVGIPLFSALSTLSVAGDSVLLKGFVKDFFVSTFTYVLRLDYLPSMLRFYTFRINQFANVLIVCLCETVFGYLRCFDLTGNLTLLSSSAQQKEVVV